ncbi:MAG: hypothetical protein R6V03_03660 [Kiritimatiellia bacterium]
MIQDTVKIYDTDFTGNEASDEGGAVSCGNASAELYRCELIGNTASEAAAVGKDAYSGPTIKLQNCLVVSNTATTAGGYVIYSKGSASGGNLTVLYTTVADNTATGGVCCADRTMSGRNASITIRNSIIAGKGDGTGIYADSGSTPTIDYNDVWNVSALYGGSASAGTGSISSDPQFSDASAGDYRIDVTSPCVGAGTGIGVSLDIEGTARDGYDMGCYETQEALAGSSLTVF